MEWLAEFQREFREPAMALLAQFWWLIPLVGLGFWLYFVLEIEPSNRGRTADAAADGDGSFGGDGDD